MTGSHVNLDQAPVFDHANLDVSAHTRDLNQHPVKMRV